MKINSVEVSRITNPNFKICYCGKFLGVIDSDSSTPKTSYGICSKCYLENLRLIAKSGGLKCR